MSDNWIVANLENAFSTWNDKMTEIWQLLTTSPQSFKGGAIWGVISGINGGLQAIGLGLLVLFFAMSIFKSTASFRDFQRPEYALKHFIRFCAAKVAITYAMDLMTAIYSICGGIVEQIAGSLGGIGGASVTLPAAIEQAVEDTGFWASIPLWLVTILGSLFITVLSFIMIMTVYGRFFKLFIYTAIAPVPLASFGGETTSFMGKSFVKSYVGVCMEGAVIVLSCIIFSAFASHSTTKVFLVPSDIGLSTEKAGYDDEDFKVIGTSWFQQIAYKYDVYNISKNGIPEAIVVYSDIDRTLREDSQYAVISDVLSALDNDGETRKQYTYWNDGNFKTAFLSDNLSNEYEPGDLVKFELGSDGKIAAAKLIYDQSAETKASDTSVRFRTFLGNPLVLNENTLRMNIDGSFMFFDLSQANYVVYNNSRQIVKTGNKEDLMNIVGLDDTDKVRVAIIYFNYKVTGCIIYD